MDPITINMAFYAAIAVGGYVVHWLQTRQSGGTPVPLPGQPAAPTPAAPNAPGELTIGHGLLLSLVLNALKAGMNMAPAQVPNTPNVPATPSVPPPDNATLQKILDKLQMPQSPLPA